MNGLVYKLLKNMHYDKKFDLKMVDRIYDSYNQKMFISNCDNLITKEEMTKLLKTTFTVFSLSINNYEFEIATRHYMNQIVCDIIDGNTVDINWCISHLWYYSYVDSKISNKYKDSLLFAQNELIKEFNINENKKEKIYRKINTKTLIK